LSRRPGFAPEVKLGRANPDEESIAGIPCPIRLGTWTRGTLKATWPLGLGVSFSYACPEDGIATLYVYDLNRGMIPDGPDSEIVKSEFEEGKRQIESRFGSVAELRTEDKVRIGTGPCTFEAKRAIFVVEGIGGPAIVSHLYLTGHRNQLVKVRISF